jgi:hypothetical protein
LACLRSSLVDVRDTQAEALRHVEDLKRCIGAHGLDRFVPLCVVFKAWQQTQAILRLFLCASVSFSTLHSLVANSNHFEAFPLCVGVVSNTS